MTAIIFLIVAVFLGNMQKKLFFLSVDTNTFLSYKKDEYENQQFW